MKELKTDYAILGAGLSGLSAARLLAQEKKDIILIEKEDQVGGLAKTLAYDSFRFDIGGHRLCITEKDNLAFLKSVLDGDLLYQKTKCKIYFEDRFIDYPPSLKSAFSLNKRYLFKIIADFIKQSRIKKIKSFEDWIRMNYGDVLFDIYFRDYTEKVWGQFCSGLSFDWAERRIGNTSLFSKKPREHISKFYYPRYGIGELSERMACHINHPLFKSSRIKEIELFKGHGQLIFEKDGEDYRVEFNCLLSTIPLRELILLIKNLPAEIVNIKDKIQYRDLILACLVIDKERLTPLHWCYIPRKDIIFSRIYEPINWSRGLSNSKETSIVCFEVFCSYNDSIWQSEDGFILNKVEEDLKKLHFGQEIKVLGGTVKRFTCAYPLYYLNYKAYLEKVLFFISQFKNIYLLGRTGTHSYLDMEECLLNTKESINLILNK